MSKEKNSLIKCMSTVLYSSKIVQVHCPVEDYVIHALKPPIFNFC